MKQYIEVKESTEHYCTVCGKRFDDKKMEQKKIYDVNFLKDIEDKNTINYSIRLCWNCTKDLGLKMQEARYNSICVQRSNS